MKLNELLFEMEYNRLDEVNQETLKKIEKVETYFGRKGGFKEVYPKIYKKIDHVRQENYIYNRSNKRWFAIMVVLKDKMYNHQEEEVEKIIKDLEIVKDNKAKVERNNLMIKILIPENSEEI